MLGSSTRVVGQVRLSDIVSALSFALDLTEGQPMGHSAKTCVIGMRLADKLKLSQKERADLYYALLLKDSGCSNNAARMYQILGSDDRQARRCAVSVPYASRRYELECFFSIRRQKCFRAGFFAVSH